MHQELQIDSRDIVPVNCHVSSYSPTDMTVHIMPVTCHAISYSPIDMTVHIMPVNCHVISYSLTDMTVVLLYSCAAVINKIQIYQAYFEYVVHILQIPQHRPIVNGSSGSNHGHVDYDI